MSSAKITLIGFYNYYNQIGEDFFKNLSVPEELDRITLIAHILQKGGEFETLYSDPDMLMNMMTVWSTSWYHTIEKWVETMTTEYKPLENYDRYEDWSDSGTENTKDDTTHTNVTNGSASSSDSSNGTSNANGQDNVSAYNSSVMQPDTSNTAHSTTTATSNSNSSTTSNENINIKNEVDLTKENNHTGRLHGNIGVTTSQHMAIEEMELRLMWGNIYDHVADLFLHEFVIPIYE